ncbi:MAG: dihydroorotate dehydrogenase (quinone) [Campylobacter sp.]
MYQNLKKMLFKFDPETAHKIAENSLIFAQNLSPLRKILAKNFTYQDEILSQNLLGLNFLNPLGMAGGFDKNATMLSGLFALGFGFVEFGTFTPKEQNGNEKPRLFRLIDENSLQNAMGFNNLGAKVIKENVTKFLGKFRANFTNPAHENLDTNSALNLTKFSHPIIANIGKNKITQNEDALNDYLYLTREFNELCDLFLINVSSPNTPNLRALQDEKFIATLLKEMKNLTKSPILFKIAPDMSEKTAISLCNCAVENGASGVVINNTSVDYALTKNARSMGGISGELIKEKSRVLFKAVARELFGRTILISCGGISDANEAYERIKFGANLVEIFTSFIYKGPGLARNLNENLAILLRTDGFKNINEAVGVNLKK